MAISQIKSRTLSDKAANDIRRDRRKKVRYLYMALVCLMIIGGLNWYFGPILWLRVDGLTAANRITESVNADAQVTAVYVHPGEHVKKGQVLATVYSQLQAQELASLNATYANTLARQAELEVKVRVATATEKALALRLRTAEDAVQALSRNKGFASATFVQAAQRDRVDALVQSVTHKAEKSAALEQLKLLSEAQDQVRNSVNLIEKRYNDGKIVAPEDGIVGSQIANVGDVLKPGDTVAQLFVGREYVWAYVGSSTLYKLHVGDQVMVTNGFSSTSGTIVEIPPLTVALPMEFQRLFHPRERGQAVKIEIPPNLGWPLETPVYVTGGSYVPAVLRGWFDSIKLRVGDVAQAAWQWGASL